MGLSGVAQNITLYPGQVGYLFGQQAMPTGPTALQTATSEAVAQNGVSRYAAISPLTGTNPVSQHQIVWSVFGSGTLDVKLQGSMDGINFVDVDEHSGSGNSGPRIVQADTTATPGPQALSAAKIVSAALYWRAKNVHAATDNLIVTITAS